MTVSFQCPSTVYFEVDSGTFTEADARNGTVVIVMSEAFNSSSASTPLITTFNYSGGTGGLDPNAWPSSSVSIGSLAPAQGSITLNASYAVLQPGAISDQFFLVSCVAGSSHRRYVTTMTSFRIDSAESAALKARSVGFAYRFHGLTVSVFSSSSTLYFSATANWISGDASTTPSLLMAVQTNSQRMLPVCGSSMVDQAPICGSLTTSTSTLSVSLQTNPAIVTMLRSTFGYRGDFPGLLTVGVRLADGQASNRSFEYSLKAFLETAVTFSTSSEHVSTNRSDVRWRATALTYAGTGTRFLIPASEMVSRAQQGTSLWVEVNSAGRSGVNIAWLPTQFAIYGVTSASGETPPALWYDSAQNGDAVGLQLQFRTTGASLQACLSFEIDQCWDFVPGTTGILMIMQQPFSNDDTVTVSFTVSRANSIGIGSTSNAINYDATELVISAASVKTQGFGLQIKLARGALDCRESEYVAQDAGNFTLFKMSQCLFAARNERILVPVDQNGAMLASNISQWSQLVAPLLSVRKIDAVTLEITSPPIPQFNSTTDQDQLLSIRLPTDVTFGTIGVRSATTVRVQRTSNVPPAPSASSSSVPIAVVAGAAVGGALLVIVAVIAAVWFVRRRRRGGSANAQQHEVPRAGTAPIHGSAGTGTASDGAFSPASQFATIDSSQVNVQPAYPYAYTGAGYGGANAASGSTQAMAPMQPPGFNISAYGASFHPGDPQSMEMTAIRPPTKSSSSAELALPVPPPPPTYRPTHGEQ